MKYTIMKYLAFAHVYRALFAHMGQGSLSIYVSVAHHASAHGGLSANVLSIFFSFEGFPILVLVKVLLQILIHWNNYLCKIVLPVSGFFLVFLYYFDCVDPMLPRHILILGGPTIYMPWL